MRFIESYPIEQLQPAAYNPRRIDDVAFARLRRSLDALGVVRPIIIGQDGTILAGHQRTKALQANGATVVPAMQADRPISTQEEVRFNQLHNASDHSDTPGVDRIPAGRQGWATISPADIPSGRPRFASAYKELCRLLLRHGAFSAGVATESGDVVSGGMYLAACKATGSPAHVRYIPDALSIEARSLLHDDYGDYCYDHLPRQTYLQSLAQLPRLRSGKAYRSALYRVVTPMIKPGDRVLDFGAGHGDEARALRDAGYDILDLEFYRRVGAHAVSRQRAQRQTGVVLDALDRYGPFDVVICDSVLNSVDSPLAEASVLAVVNAFCRLGGVIAVSGRRRAFVDQVARGATAYEAKKRHVNFIDGNGYSASFHHGGWSYQRFHTDAEAIAIAAAIIGPSAVVTQATSSWQAVGIKEIELPPDAIRQGIAFEFDLPYPDGTRLAMVDHAMRSFAPALHEAVT